VTGRRLLSVRTALAGVVLAVALAGPSGAPGLALALGAAGVDQGPSSGRPWEWWNDPEVQATLGLSADTVRRIDDLYKRRNAELRPVVHEYLRERDALDRMTRERVADDATYQVQVMRFEQARARLSESRTVMLYRMYRELTPEQHNKLQEIFDQRFGRGGNRERPSPTAK
jgi:Spy/CpxP family protein refolding chaperone